MGAGGPGGLPPQMPGPVVTARVLLFIAGGLWGIGAAIMFLGGVAAQGALDELDVPGIGANAAMGVLLLFAVFFAGAAVLHLIPAINFGKGRSGTRVTAIIAGVVNALLPVVGIVGITASGMTEGGAFFFYLLWAATGILTIVFCSMSAASQWFHRPRM